jgi:hypothetical protein
MFSAIVKSDFPDRKVEFEQMVSGVEDMIQETVPVIEYLTDLSAGQKTDWSLEEALSGAMEIAADLKTVLAWFKAEAQKEPHPAIMEAWFKEHLTGARFRPIPEGAPTLEELRARGVKTDFSDEASR